MNTLPSGTVTFLFTDIEDSTRLWQEQPEAMAIAHAQHNEILRGAIESNHGYVFQIVGDAFCAAFHNAQDALTAALVAQRKLAAPQNGSALQLKVRTGLHTGTAEIQADGKYEGYVTIASCQRVMTVAYGNQVLLSYTTADLLGTLPDEVSLHDMGEHQLKSLRTPLRLYQLIAPDLPQDFPPIQSLNHLPNNLPVQLTNFIGREKEISAIKAVLESARLVTLIGPGGTGKTRLSLQIAEEQLSHFKDGVWFIELAPISDPANIVSTIASAFDLREVQGIPFLNTLLDYLRAKHLLLILDNCEHLVETSAQIADQILHTSPQVKIIASSREALGIHGESVYRVPSLPDDDATSLFVERATKADSRFQLTEHNASSIAQICSRLDGIPLAIELAAARVKMFTPEQISNRLDDMFKLLTGGSRTALPRQQTLRALIDWSYQSLNEVEQISLRRLAVFSGGWTFEAAEAVIGETDAMDGLLGLVNKSLVNVEEQDGESRYRFLETIRQYGLEKLLESGEAVQARNSHLAYFEELCENSSLRLFTPEMESRLNLFTRELDNLRSALKWAADNDPAKALKILNSIGNFWSVRDHNVEAVNWCQLILKKTESISGLDVDRGNIYNVLGWCSITMGEHKLGRAAAEEALVLGRKTNDDKIIARAYGVRLLSSVFIGDMATAFQSAEEGETFARERKLKSELAFILSARAQLAFMAKRDIMKSKEYLEESWRIAKEAGFLWASSFAAFGLARIAGQMGDIETARKYFSESTDIAERIGNLRIVHAGQSELAHVLRAAGQYDEAISIYRDLLPKWKHLGHRAAVAHEMECIAFILAKKEEFEKSALLLGAADALREKLGSNMTLPEQEEYNKAVDDLKANMDEKKFASIWAEGRSKTMDEAIKLALENNE